MRKFLEGLTRTQRIETLTPINDLTDASVYRLADDWEQLMDDMDKDKGEIANPILKRQVVNEFIWHKAGFLERIEEEQKRRAQEIDKMISRGPTLVALIDLVSLVLVMLAIERNTRREA